jgi:hypothetical protein
MLSRPPKSATSSSFIRFFTPLSKIDIKGSSSFILILILILIQIKERGEYRGLSFIGF